MPFWKSSTPKPAPFLIIGLGNPGREYRNNRHNVGFMLLDRLAERLGTGFARMESKALVAKGSYQEQRLVLAKPQTYMNLSGQTAGSLSRFYKVPPGNMLVAFDDMDLPLGTLRMRPSGGSGGQRGMASILQQLATQDVPRMRIGISRPPGRMDPADYILQDFSAAEMTVLLPTLDRAVDAVLVFVTQGLAAAMNQYNGTVEESSG